MNIGHVILIGDNRMVLSCPILPTSRQSKTLNAFPSLHRHNQAAHLREKFDHYVDQKTANQIVAWRRAVDSIRCLVWAGR